uniref:NADH-ubiquinone oxidoreductase chain 3 n=1 Tax=Trisidos kiyonoi TaxID=935009 RepID=A0A1U9ALT2_TRIKY|nr:NADH dehydrogenase subunit 3 [Trisidos kiyonoi]
MLGVMFMWLVLGFMLSWSPLGWFIFGTVIMVSIIYGLGAVLGFRKGIFYEKSSPYECGFEPIGSARSSFSLRFFLLLVLFLVFDVEVVLLFPVLSVICSSSLCGAFIAVFQGVVFLIMLLVGLWYEWSEGALEWSKD